MTSARKKGEFGKFPLELSKQYRMDVVGYLRIDLGNGYKESAPYGWIKEIRVFVNEGVRLQPGDRVQVEITKVNRMSAVSKAIGNYGSFIEPIMREFPEKEFSVRLTGKGRRDARNAVSEPEYGGGLFGVLVIVNNVSDDRTVESIYDGLSYKKCMIKLDHIGLDRNFRYFIIGSPADPENLRKGDEIFTGEWYAHEDPELENIRPYFHGVPFDPSIALYFRDDKRREIMFKSRPMDVSGMRPDAAVREFSGRCNPGTFRVALAREEYVDLLEQSIERAGLKHDRLESK